MPKGQWETHRSRATHRDRYGPVVVKMLDAGADVLPELLTLPDSQMARLQELIEKALKIALAPSPGRPRAPVKASRT